MSTTRGFFLSIFFLAVFVPAFAQAQSSVAIIDVQRLLLESKVGKNIQEQMKAHKDKFMADLSQKETALREEEKQLILERGTLSKEAFAKKAQKFEGKLAQARRLTQTQKKALDEAYAGAMKTVRAKLDAAVTAIASEKGYDLVLSRANVIIASDSINITDDALVRLNVAITSVNLKIAP